MTRQEIALYIASLLDDSHIIDVSVSEEVEDIMRRSQIIKKYGNGIKQLPDGRYHIRYNGKQIFRKSFDLIVDELFKRENNIGVITLDSIAVDFFEYRFTNTSGGTYAKDCKNYETFIKGTAIAEKDITKIVLNDGVKWTNHCLNTKPDMKEKYFQNVRGTLNQMFSFAIANNWIEKNPIEKIAIHKDHLAPKAIHTDSELIFEDEERKTVCKLAFQDAIDTKSSIPLAIPFLFQTGLRDGELCALKWKDIEKKGIHIQAEMVEHRSKENKFLGYKYVSHTKTPAGNRIVGINKEVEKILSYIKKTNLENGFPIRQNDFIFLRAYRGNVCECTSRCFETRIKKYCKKAKMDILKSQHDIRRTFATNLFYAGMNPKDIQALMGHENIDQTMAYVQRKENADIIDYLEAISVKSVV